MRSIFINILAIAGSFILNINSRKEKYSNNNDAIAWSYVAINTILLLATLGTSYFNHYPTPSAIMGFALLLAILDNSWALTKLSMEYQMVLVAFFVVIGWWLHLRDVNHGIMYLATMILLISWKSLNVMAQFRLVQSREQIIKNSTYQATIGGIHHELLNITNIVDGCLNSLKEDPTNKMALEILQRNLCRLPEVLQSMQDISNFSTQNYPGEQKVVIFGKGKKAS